jgi:hypothetical protein
MRAVDAKRKEENGVYYQGVAISVFNLCEWLVRSPDNIMVMVDAENGLGGTC